jgi:uracil-DNA glycosylase
MNVVMEESWKAVLQHEFNKPYFHALTEFVRHAYQTTKIYPPPSQIFNAFAQTPFNDVRVVILGQDPYHGPGQAHGLAFSVQDGVQIPPSLQNIYKEIVRDLGGIMPKSGNLTYLTKQGVLLLNATLTVEAGKAGSHQNKGWETFTDSAIKALSDQKEGLIFLLWGSYAQKKGALIDRTKHHVLESHHPSPLSAHRGFLGNGHFSKTNELLLKTLNQPIEWLP